MISTVIIDDEPALGNGLKRMLELYHSDIRVEAICYNVQEAKEALNRFQPDLVFLDVQLGHGQTGFDVLINLREINFKVIFVTGFDKYAVQAIKFSALDYLLKPIDEEELKTALEKFRAEIFISNMNRMESFISAWSNPGNQQNKIPLPTMSGYDMVAVEDIIYCEGISNQTLFILNNQKKILISKTLKECEDIFLSYNFIRIHKSYLINLNQVKRYVKEKEGAGSIVLSEEINIPVSRSFKERLMEKMRIIRT